MFTITTNSPEQTSLLGEKIANLIQDNLIICLEGDLGAGKTLFTQSLCKALKVKEIVKLLERNMIPSRPDRSYERNRTRINSLWIQHYSI